jgi:hypothetical protein
MRANEAAIDRAWPFTPADAGQLLAVTGVGEPAVAWPFNPVSGFER